MAPAGMPNRLEALSPEQRALLRQRLLQRRAPATEPATIARRDRTVPCPLSLFQQRLWFLDQLTPGSSAYNAPFAVRMTGRLHPDAFRAALDGVVRRHEVLRTTYQAPEGSPVQVVRESVPTCLQVVDLRGLPAEAQANEAEQLVAAEAKKPFDLARDLMLRALLVQLGDEEFLFLHVSHHIAWDLRSKEILYRELPTLYQAHCDGQAAPLTELPIQYGDFAVWQQQYLLGERLQRLVGYWTEQLRGVPFALELPLDRPRPSVQSLRGAKFSFRFPAELTQAARQLSGATGATLYMTLLTGFKVFLLALSGQEDLCVGAPMAGRNRPETEPLIGFFISTMLLRTALGGGQTFRTILQRVRDTTIGAYEHQELPFEKLVEIARPPRDLSRNPLFQVNFRVATTVPVQLELPGMATAAADLIDTATSKFDLALEIAVNERALGYWEYSTDLFDEATVARMNDGFQQLLGAALAEPDRVVGELEAFRRLAEYRQRLKEARQGKPLGIAGLRRAVPSN